ncbi:DNA breaking-rejoining enzyme, partial [Gymnopus androsaceus JB14]
IPEEVIKAGNAVMLAGLAPSTMTTYAAGLLRWSQYCDLMKIPEVDRMPASDVLIIGFMGFHMGKVSGGTVKNWLAGLRAWHELKGATWPADSRRIRFARRGANVEGAAHKRRPRHPITVAHLFALRRALNFNTPFHCAIWACALTAFWSCRRLGEITVPSASKFSTKYHVSRCSADLRFQQHRNAAKSANFRIPWTKTTKEEGANVVVTGRPDELCGITALEQHLRVNAGVPEGYSLFGYVDEKGQPRHMVKNVFLAFCYDVWEKAAMKHVLGHSFRIGGAVALLLAGVKPEVVAATGGWTSLAFLLYWRRLEEVIPIHISKAYNQNEINTLRKTVAAFQKAFKISDSLLNACITGSKISSLDD